MKLLKKILLVLVSFGMVFAIFAGSFSAATASGNCGKSSNQGGASSVKWSVNGYVLTISGKGDMADYEDGEQPYLDYLDYVTEIRISEGVTSVGKSAFNTPYAGIFSTSTVAKVTLPSTIKKINDYAFRGCATIQEISIPEGVTYIGVEAFYGCNSITYVKLPDSLTDLGAKAFKYCTDLQTVIFGRNVKEIKNETFYFDYALTVVKFKRFTAQKCGDSVFNWSGTRFYVPKGTKAAYVESLQKDETKVIEYGFLKVNVVKTANGTTTFDQTFVYEKGDVVTIETNPVEGYKVKSVVYQVGQQAPVTVNADEKGEYKFAMPNADVTVTVTYTETDETLFNRYKDEKIQQLKNQFIEEQDSEETQGIIDDAVKQIEDLKFDEKKNLKDNKKAVDEIYDEAIKDILEQRFDEYKEELKKQIEELLEEGDKLSVKNIVTEDKQDLDNLKYDHEKTYEENKAAADKLVETTKPDVELQRAKENFNDYKEELKDQLDGILLPEDSEKVKKIVDDAKKALDALEYDEEKNLAQNKEEADKIADPVEAAVEKQRLLDKFDEYKESAKKTLDLDKRSYDSNETKKILDNYKKKIDNLPYNENKTLQENYDAIDSLVEEGLYQAQLQRYKENFENYKTQLRGELETLYHELTDNPSAELQAIYETYDKLLGDLIYDESIGLIPNNDTVTQTYKEAVEALRLQNNKDIVEQFKDEKDNEVEKAKEEKEFNDEIQKVIDELEKQINEFQYNEELTLEENLKNIADLYDKLLKVINDVPVMLEGDGQVHEEATEEEVGFRSSAPIDTFIEVRINGEIVDKENYDVFEGSTIVKLHDDYVKKLEPGTYQLDIVSTGGVATGEFTITKKPINWVTISCVGVPCLLVIILIALFKNKKKDQEEQQPAEAAAE